MPLGKSKIKNIAELLRTYKSTGKIGNATPKNLAHAQRIASAIAYEKAKETKPNHFSVRRKRV